MPWVRPYVTPISSESHNLAPIGQHDRRVLYLLPASGLWWDDYQPVRQEIERHGVAVVAAAQQHFVKGIGSEPKPDVHAEMLIKNIDPDDYDGVVIAGGVMDEFTDGGATARQVNQLLHQMLEDDKIVAAICVGQTVLADGGFLQGRRAARNEMVALEYPAAARWVNQSIVHSGQIITADEPEQAVSFADAIVEALCSKSG